VKPARSPYVFIILFSFLVSLPILAQEYYLTHFGEDDGLLSNEVNCAFQDSIGQMWIGTNGGLHLFNGINFKSINRGVPSKYLRDIKSMKDHTLVLSHDAGLSFIRSAFGTYKIQIPTSLNTLVNDFSLEYPNNLFNDSKDRLWISQPNGNLSRIAKEGVESIISEETEMKNAKIHFSFAPLNETDFFIASPQGKLYLWEEDKRELRYLGKVFNIEDILYVKGNLYLAGDNLAIIESPESTKKLNKIWQADGMDTRYTSLASDTLGKIFVGTAGSGLYQFTDQEGAFQLREVFSHNDPHRVDRLPFKHINSIYITADNSIWLCTNEGLGLLQPRFFEGVLNLPNDNATTLALAENGDIYVCMGDIYKIHKYHQEFSATKLDVPNVGAFNGLSVDGDILWAGTNNGQIVKMDLDGNLISIFPFSSRGAGIFRICTDSQKRKWFCQAPKEEPILGLGMIDEEDQIHMYGKNKGFDNRMLIVKESPRNELYAAGIGPKSYLYRYYADRDEFVNMSIPFTFPVSPNFEVHDIAIDDQGLVWLATTDGLLRYDRENILRPDLGQIYTGKEVRAVAVLPDNSIWLSTDIYGMLRYKDGKILSFGEDAGLPTKIMAYRGLLVDKDSKLWINTLEGLTHTSQNAPEPFPTPTPILNSISYKKKALDLDVMNYELVSGGKLELKFLSLTFPGSNNEYQYAFQFDEILEWKDVGYEQNINLKIENTQIKGLKIRARKGSGYDWSEPVDISLTILFPWYKRPLTIILLSFLGIGILVYLWKANNRRFHKTITDLKSNLNEKNGHDSPKNRVEQDKQHQQTPEPKINEEDILKASMNLIYEVTELTESGMKWDHILEHLSLALIKLPYTKAFEIGILNKHSNKIFIEGYSHTKEEFYQREESWSKSQSIYTTSIKSQKADLSQYSNAKDDKLLEWTGPYKTIITVPFILRDNKDAVICIYGNEKLYNEDVMKAIKSIANYLEIIS
jgi:ligand-binding sensor domain-containing protein